VAKELFANTATTTLAAALTDTVATSVSVNSSTGFPAAVTGTSQFRIRIDSELMTVTNVSGTTWTVTRGAESSTAATHLIGAAVVLVVTAGSLGALQQISISANASPPSSPATNDLWLVTDVGVGSSTALSQQHHGSQATTTAAWFVLATWVSDLATAGLTNSASGITVANTGYYAIGGSCLWPGNAAGRRAIQPTINGTVAPNVGNTTLFSGSAGAIATPVAPQFLSLTAGDLVSLQIYQDSGGALSATVAELHLWRVG
jgi:hypothetical protein